MADPVEATSRGTGVGAGKRIEALDGLRGLVIISVVLNHAGGVLWPRGHLYEVPVIAGLLGGGSVLVFFIVGALMVTVSLLRDRERGTFDPLRFYLRRVVRLGVQLVPLCAVLVAIHILDKSYVTSTERLVNNVFHTLTYTLNVFVDRDIFGLRPEVGHLWYLSVQQQCYLVLPLILVLFGRWPRLMSVGLLILAGLVYWQRQIVLDERGWVAASSFTTTRSDALILGVVAALCLPWVRGFRGKHHLLWITGVLLVVLHLGLQELPAFAYLGPWSIAFTVVATLHVMSIWTAERETRTLRLLSTRSLKWLGNASLSIFIWHVPVILVLSRNTPNWSWPLRTLVAFVILAVLVIALERWVERPTRQLLANSRLFRIRPRGEA